MAPFGSALKRKDLQDKRKPKEKQQLQAADDALPPPPPMAGDEFALPTREYVRPDNQLALSDAQLGEEIPRMLTANNPVAPKNLARFNMKERCFKFDPMVDQTVVHYATDGWLLHKTSEEAKRQADVDKTEAEAAAKFQAEVDRAAREKEAGLDVEPPDDSRQLRNQFNFGERAAQTFNYPLRDRATMTEPPPTASASGSCSAWDIYDEYMRDVERQRLEDASKPKGGSKRPAAGAPGHATAAAPPAGGGNSTLQGPEASGAALARRGSTPAAGEEQEAALAAAGPGVKRALRILDRMVCQNSYADVAMDFKYWEDQTDAFRPGEGSLLPLWTFKCPRGKKHVTSIAWCPTYDDMFAVGYGSYHFHKQTGGLVAIHSLKNPAAPECMFVTTSGVMAVHFHPSYCNLLAVGCYDGSVAVYDARSKGGPPLYQATVKSGKHSDAVWQVVWLEDELQKTLQFVSVSTDGDVILWTLAKSELQPERLMRLQAPGAAAAGAGAGAGSGSGAEGGGAGAAGAAGAASAKHVVGGVCMDFCWAAGEEHVYVVGTEEGGIVQCSKAYSSEYLATYSGHTMPAYAVRWNRLHPRVFLSASADWSLRVWDARRPAAGPVLSFDLGDAVGDAAWAPYSSTVLAAVTDDGRAHVFDLATSRLAPLCSQKVTKSARLTKLAFNGKHPVMLVGDSKGNVTCLKLSPNLRKGGSSAAAGAAAAGTVAGAAAAVGGAAAAGRGKFEAAEQQRLDAVLDVAMKGHAGGSGGGVPAAAAAAAKGGHAA